MATSHATTTIQNFSLLGGGNADGEIQNQLDILADFVIERWLEEQEIKKLRLSNE